MGPRALPGRSGPAARAPRLGRGVLRSGRRARGTGRHATEDPDRRPTGLHPRGDDSHLREPGTGPGPDPGHYDPGNRRPHHRLARRGGRPGRDLGQVQRHRGVMRYLTADADPQAGRVSMIGLGTWQFGSREWGYGPAYARQEARAIVRRALELGVTLFDTAEIYGFGRSERILGEALGPARESAFLATKLFPLLPVAPVVQQRAVASANRLGTSRLDLYQVHQPNPLVRDGTIMRGMRALQRVGLIGEVGVSNYSLQRWRAAEDALGSPVLSNQVCYSLVARSPERDLLPYAQQRGRVVLAYSPLAQGLLSGRYDQDNRPANRVRAANPMFLPGNLARAAELLAGLREVAGAHPPSSSSNATPPPPTSTSPTANTRPCPPPRPGSGPSPGPPPSPAWPA